MAKEGDDTSGDEDSGDDDVDGAEPSDAVIDTSEEADDEASAAEKPIADQGEDGDATDARTAAGVGSKGDDPHKGTSSTPCSHCDTSGQCPRCGGKGRRMLLTCKECRGSGRCPVCGGPGFVWSEPS